MNVWLHVMAEKAIAIAITAFFAAGNWIAGPRMMPPKTMPETAIIAQTAAPVFSPSNMSPTSSATTGVVPGLLPKIKLLPQKQKQALAADANAAASPAKPAAPATPPATVAPGTITADWLLGNTTLSFKERRDGPYELIFKTKISGAQKLEWGLTDATLGGGASGIPQFSIASSCDPPPAEPQPGAFDANPAFAVRTSYTCMISLTPSEGNDRRARSKQFVFQTDPGSLVATPPSAMNTLLTNDTNVGGFVFNNEDARPATVTGVTLDVSYTGLSTSTGPLVLRFVDGRTDAALADYHIESIASDPSRPYSARQTGIAIPLSFTVDPQSEKLLTINALGVHRLFITGADPTLTIALKGANTADGAVKTVINQAEISWSCVVALTGYDPNATSGAFAAGTACR